ncbi:MAG: hypothetical protein JWP62_2034, partial [Blastococcus sp.]|nr:hypothetical protein [Blastococcus sp.]
MSLVEAVLARWLVELSGRRYFVTGLPWHETHRSSRVDGAEAERPVVGESSSESAACVDNEVVPERFGAFGRLLEAGAGHLAAARAAQVEQRRQAAV